MADEGIGAAWGLWGCGNRGALNDIRCLCCCCGREEKVLLLHIVSGEQPSSLALKTRPGANAVERSGNSLPRRTACCCVSWRHMRPGLGQANDLCILRYTVRDDY